MLQFGRHMLNHCALCFFNFATAKCVQVAQVSLSFSKLWGCIIFRDTHTGHFTWYTAPSLISSRTFTVVAGRNRRILQSPPYCLQILEHEAALAKTTPTLNNLLISTMFNMDVSKNRGTPKPSILIGFSIINHPFLGYPYFNIASWSLRWNCKLCLRSLNNTWLWPAWCDRQQGSTGGARTYRCLYHDPIRYQEHQNDWESNWSRSHFNL